MIHRINPELINSKMTINHLDWILIPGEEIRYDLEMLELLIN